MHIPGSEDVIHAGLILTGFCLDIASAINSYLEGIRYILLASKETCCNQYNLCLQNLLAVRNLLHVHSACLRVFLPGKLHKLNSTQIAILILNKFLYSRFIDSRIMSEHGNCLFLTIICLADLRPFRPWIVGSTMVRSLWHHLNLCHGLRTQTDRSTNTVVTRITTSDNDYMLILGRYEIAVL